MSEPSNLERGIRRVHRLSVAAGVIVIALVMVSSVTSPKTCGTLESHYPPIVAFELARSDADLQAIFGDGRRRMARCRAKAIDGMDQINHVDFALFMPAYGLFLGAAFLGLRRRGRRVAAAGVPLVGLALAADAVENVCLLGLTPALDAGSTWMAVLPWATGVKWLALGGVGAVAAVALWHGRRGGRVSAAVCMVTPVATILAIADPRTFGALVTTGMAASWAILFVDGVVQARRRLT